tara:strand:+ start:54 stop:395 length:342 start_codon:yes stop_codon:yes gene_type:complete
MINKEIIYTILIVGFAQILVWYQLNGQLISNWCKTHPWILSIAGIPISYLFILSTKYGYVGFGNLWSVRLTGFAVGMLVFPFITYWMLGEGITIKTSISILLALCILLLQLIN